MRAPVKTALALMLAAGLCPAARAATELKAHVRSPDGRGLPGFAVYAVEFGLHGPSTHSRTALTDAAGDAVLSLEDGREDSVYFSSQGFSPTLAEQFRARRQWPGSVTSVTLTPAGHYIMMAVWFSGPVLTIFFGGRAVSAS